MKVAIISVVFVLVAGILGKFFPPTEDQLRPLAPEPGSGASHDDNGHH